MTKVELHGSPECSPARPGDLGILLRGLSKHDTQHIGDIYLRTTDEQWRNLRTGGLRYDTSGDWRVLQPGETVTITVTV